MKAYQLEHFYQGEKVYQLKNEKLIMTVISLDKNTNTIFCGLLNKDNDVSVQHFKPVELRKERDLNLLTRVF